MRVLQWSRTDQVLLEGLLWALPGAALLQVGVQLVQAVRGNALSSQGHVPDALVRVSEPVVGPLSGTVVVADPTAAQYAWSLVPSVVLLVLALVVTRLLLGVVRGLRDGDPFTRANARRLRVLAVVVVVSGVLVPIVRTMAHDVVLDPLLPDGPRTATLQLDLWPALGGILVGFLAEVFARGARLREDVEGLV